MTVSIKEKLDRIIQEKSETQAETDTPNGEIALFEQSDYFAVENLRNSPACLELRLRDNSSKAIPYSYILEMNFHPSDGIEIYCTTKRILITGRNLKQLYLFLTAFRVKYIQTHIGNDLVEGSKLFVKEIKIEEV